MRHEPKRGRGGALAGWLGVVLLPLLLTGMGWGLGSVSAAGTSGRFGTWQTLSGDGSATLRGLSLTGWQTGMRFAEVLAPAGDADGDGMDDLLVGCGRAGVRGGMGVAWLFRGGEGGLDAGRYRLFRGRAAATGFGRLVGAGPGPGGRRLVGVGRRAAGGQGSLLELWDLMPASGRVAEPASAWLVEASRTEHHDQLRGWSLPGDVDGDGLPDFLAIHVLDPGSGESELRLYPGTDRGFAAEHAWAMRAPAAGWLEGAVIVSLGDFDRDGRADFGVGAPRWGRGGNGATGGGGPGRVLIFCGMPAPECVVLAQVLDPLAVDEMAEYGTAVAAGEDLDGDGHGDLVVAAPFPESGGISDSGRVYVHRGTGSRAGFQREPAWLLRGTHPRDRFGGSLALLRDFDGDQRVDLAIGAPGWCGLHLGEGSVVVVSARFMASGPIDALPHLKLHGGVPGAAFGRRLVAAGDLDGDGLSDLAASTVEVGAHLPDKAGRLEVVYGGQVDLGAEVQFAIRYPGAAVFPDPTVSEASLVRAGSEGRLGPVGGLTGAAGLAEPETRSAGRARGVLPAGPAVLLAAGAACGLAGIGSLGWWGWSRLRLRIRDGERQRISRDLHDELGAQLDRLKAVGTESGREAVAPDVAREVSVGIERVIWSLDPGRRTWSDLACGLADLAEGILGDTPVRCRFEFPERPPAEELPPNTLEALYRVTQEALNNVRKHSFAGHAWVRLAWEPSGLRLEIEDDGVGLPGSEDGNGVPARTGSGGSVPAAGMGRGLEQMTARIREVGGTCRWEASEPTGVRVVVTVPRR